MVHALKYQAILVFMCLPNLTSFHSISLHPGPAEQFQNWLGIKFCKCMPKLLIKKWAKMLQSIVIDASL